MRQILLPIVVLLVAGSVAWASLLGTLQYFNASFQGSDVRLEWAVDSEASIATYELSRKRNDESTYTRLVLLQAGTGSAGSYSYIDDLMKSSQEPGAVNYKLVVKGPTSSQTYFATLANTPTAVQRSWGSIKSMFK